MLFRRQFTIMVVPDAQALLRRFHLRGGQIAGGLAGLVVLAVLALASPALLFWNVHLAREKAVIAAEREQLAARAQDVEQTVKELRQKLARQEKRAERFAFLAGLEPRTLNSAGEGAIVDTPADAGARYEQARGEAEALADRATLFDRRLSTVEEAFGRQAERLARVPSLVPVRGLFGGSFGWRRDPFTGLSEFHKGLDISGPAGTPIKAPADGVVIKTERDSGYGNTLALSHGEGLVTRYGHLSAFKVKPGEKVRRGDVIALMGSTGRSTGSHLHYEILENGVQVDPLRYIGEDQLD